MVIDVLWRISVNANLARVEAAVARARGLIADRETFERIVREARNRSQRTVYTFADTLNIVAAERLMELSSNVAPNPPRSSRSLRTRPRSRKYRRG